ncbi:MAG: acylphosphatase [candidate division FCPU426 bacterium]
MQRVRITVIGGVQGVGFRFFAQREAQNRQLTGYVKNCPDGSVVLEAQGKPSALEALALSLEHGPRMARVERVQVSPKAVCPGEMEFEIRFD